MSEDDMGGNGARINGFKLLMGVMCPLLVLAVGAIVVVLWDVSSLSTTQEANSDELASIQNKLTNIESRVNRIDMRTTRTEVTLKGIEKTVDRIQTKMDAARVAQGIGLLRWPDE